YVGKFPGKGYHGKVLTVANKQPYIRSKPALKERLEQWSNINLQKNVHDELNRGTDVHEMPRNLKQIQNLKTCQWSVQIRENPQSFLVYHFCTGNLVVGSDDEQALIKSIQRSFPGATHIQCTRHLKNNVKDYLCHKIGVRDNEKKQNHTISIRGRWIG
ncbi:hypothetical protein MAR_019957, partial [Mya arenaria]